MAEWKDREYDKYSHDKWYKNTWFHYKAPIIVGLLLIAFTVILFFSSRMTDPIDMYILYLTESPDIYEEKTAALTEVLTQYAIDLNEDGKSVVYIENVYVGSEFNPANVHKQKEKIMTALRSGDCLFLIADETGAQYLKASEACMNLSEKFPEEPETSFDFDGYFWNWNGSEFKNSNEIFTSIFEADPLYFGVRVYMGTIAELTENSRKNFEQADHLIKALITNTKPE